MSSGALEVSGQHCMVLQLLHAMNTANIVVDLETYNAALRTLARAGRYQDALNVLSEIKQAQMKPDIGTAEAIVQGHVNAGKVLDAVQLASEFHQQGLTVRERCLSSIVAN